MRALFFFPVFAPPFFFRIALLEFLLLHRFSRTHATAVDDGLHFTLLDFFFFSFPAIQHFRLEVEMTFITVVCQVAFMIDTAARCAEPFYVFTLKTPLKMRYRKKEQLLFFFHHLRFYCRYGASPRAVPSPARYVVYGRQCEKGKMPREKGKTTVDCPPFLLA